MNKITLKPPALLSGLLRDLSGLLYPVSCLVCGDRQPDDTYLCDHCLHYAFEPANPEELESCEGLILPDHIRMQDSLWEFDKGGFLQDVLHQIKYGGLAELGLTLGRHLGHRLSRNRWIEVSADLLLLPVPLHPSRERKRGYNQSRLIARGMAKVTRAEVAPERALVRRRYTRTQTGLNAAQRKRNLEGAFEIRDAAIFRNRHAVIVDDVITTGATALAVANRIRQHVQSVSVATIARA